ncbi:hypothetical protein KEM54_002671 [Ascosphaera aggregata]|nr:hypothetical protein KEM54_002671 [Ascosphaera aggregata]
MEQLRAAEWVAGQSEKASYDIVLGDWNTVLEPIDRNPRGLGQWYLNTNLMAGAKMQEALRPTMLNLVKAVMKSAKVTQKGGEQYYEVIDPNAVIEAITDGLDKVRDEAQRFEKRKARSRNAKQFKLHNRIRSLEAEYRTKRRALKIQEARCKLNAYWEARERKRAIAGRIKWATHRKNLKNFWKLGKPP